MSAEIDTLWALSGLDDELAKVKAALARFPEERDALERHVADATAKLDTHKATLADRQRRRRELEVEIGTLTAGERKFQSQLPTVKKNEEYQALLHEIDGVKRRRSDLETEVLVSLEAEEDAARARPALDAGLAAVQRERSDGLARLAAAEAAERGRAAALEAERRGHVERLPVATRSRYERIHGSRAGRAVVAILKGACGGCFRAQPPQVLQEARHRERLLTCDGCGRLLVWPPDA